LCWLYDQALGHGWIAAADQQAFAAQIQAALDAGIARAGMGWDGICSPLHSGVGDIVTSLSVGNSFPDAHLALQAGTWSPGLRNPDDPDELDEHWDQLGHAGQWELCMQALRAQPSRQWRPGGSYVFGDFTLEPDAGLVSARALVAAARTGRPVCPSASPPREPDL
jgi:hypothetical protein